DCSPGKSVLILVPYRQREQHLAGSAEATCTRFWQRQQHLLQQHCGWESSTATPRSKGQTDECGILESVRQLRRFDCVVFHDVDLLPTNPFVPYNCPAYPRHISVSIDKFGYSLPYKQLVGGVLAMPVRHFLKVNGYSNLFWGWGGEDDDMEARPNPRLARYRMIRHQARKEFLNERYRLDGLNSLSYSLVASESRPLYTHFLIDLGQPPRSSSFLLID
uniref:Beta-1,4-galactosyltransferase 4 n=1 Tax=Macrostomum lignano TaxID=282301 RepID=A0A1I8FRC8_9PLAT